LCHFLFFDYFEKNTRLFGYDANVKFQVYEDGFDSSVALESLDCYELTDFKSKLTAVLSRPFKQAEYDKLYKEANERKPLIKQKHLRSMSISYETNEKGQSYFDHFPGNQFF